MNPESLSQIASDNCLEFDSCLGVLEVKTSLSREMLPPDALNAERRFLLSKGKENHSAAMASIRALNQQRAVDPSSKEEMKSDPIASEPSDNKTGNRERKEREMR
jgi:hypothetical protein